MNIADEIIKLASLRDSGILTQAEFEAAKLHAVAGSSDSPTTNSHDAQSGSEQASSATPEGLATSFPVTRTVGDLTTTTASTIASSKKTRGVVVGAVGALLVMVLVVAAIVNGASNFTKEKGAYTSLTDLRNALVATGYNCPEWEQDNGGLGASESGQCSGKDRFSLYTDEEQYKRQLGIYQAVAAVPSATESADSYSTLTIVGPNWFVYTSDSAGANTAASTLGMKTI